MVKKLKYMGEEKGNLLMKKIDASMMWLYKQIPFTYFGMFYRPFKEFRDYKKKITVLDLGCGDGSATQNLGLPKNFEITGVDIFPPYLRIAKQQKIYKKLIKMDVAKYRPDKKYDIVMTLHVLEHFNKTDGLKYLNRIEKFAIKKVIVATPIGHFPQAEYDKNPHQIHKSSWIPVEMIKMGYKVEAQGLKLLWGNENVGAKYGALSYILFLISCLLTPLLRVHPELGTYMICEKNLK